MTMLEPARTRDRVPADTFPVRLAIVRAEMGWNYDQAAKATGIGSETWRLWEKRKRHCTTLEQTCRVIAEATGFSYKWLMVGGPLIEPTADAAETNLRIGWRYRAHLRSRPSRPKSLIRRELHAAA